MRTRALSHRPENALNAVCPYFAMFPLEYPLRVLAKHRKGCPTVVDPFCGRGTTLFAARKLGLEAWGIDTSDVAVAIAQAKLAAVDSNATLRLAKRLIEENLDTPPPDTEFFRNAYHPETLRELAAIREGLLTRTRESNASVLLRATVLGCLHGPISKTTSTQAYLSNQMQRTFSPKPAYAVRYWKANGLVAPRTDALTILKRKLERLATSCSKTSNRYAQVVRGDARRAASFKRMSNRFSVVVTSPPYYGMGSYFQDQWLRHWFLGGSSTVDYRDYIRLDQSSQISFAQALGTVWSNCATTTADALDVYIRFGVIPSFNIDAKALLRDSLDASRATWKVVSVRDAGSSSAGRRQAMQMQGQSSALREFDFHVVRV